MKERVGGDTCLRKSSFLKALLCTNHGPVCDPFIQGCGGTFAHNGWVVCAHKVWEIGHWHQFCWKYNYHTLIVSKVPFSCNILLGKCQLLSVVVPNRIRKEHFRISIKFDSTLSEVRASSSLLFLLFKRHVLATIKIFFHLVFPLEFDCQFGKCK